MEFGAVPVKIFVRHCRVPDTGIKIQDPHLFQFFLQRFIKFSSQALFSHSMVNINAGFTGPVISGPVSYTHLDVYKRQTSIRPFSEFFRKLSAPLI